MREGVVSPDGGALTRAHAPLARTRQAGGGEVRVPRYDKTAFSGRGTRAPEDDWPSVAAPLDVVLFEGWMLGFAPVGAEAARAVSPDLEAVDARLEAYAEELESVVDAWLVVKIGDPNVRGRECPARALLRVGVGCLCVGEGSRPLDGSLCERVRGACLRRRF